MCRHHFGVHVGVWWLTFIIMQAMGHPINPACTESVTVRDSDNLAVTVTTVNVNKQCAHLPDSVICAMTMAGLQFANCTHLSGILDLAYIRRCHAV